MSITLTTNGRASNILVQSDLGSSDWTIGNGAEVRDCAFEDNGGYIDAAGDAETVIANLRMKGNGASASSFLRATGSEQKIWNVAIEVDGVTNPVVLVSGDHNDLTGYVKDIGRTVVDVSGDGNTVNLRGTSRPNLDNTYDLVTVSGDENDVQVRLSTPTGVTNNWRYDCLVSGTADNNHTCVVSNNAQTGDYNHTSSGTNNTRCPIINGAPSAYTPTNVSTDRAYDANSTTLDEVADVLGTLIADLQAAKIIG